jgi:hypothetical protein
MSVTQSTTNHQVVIDGDTYTFYNVSPRELTKVLVLISGILGQPLVDNLDNAKIDLTKLSAGSQKMDVVKEIVKAVMSCMKPEVVDPIIDTLFSACICAGKGNVKDNVDIIFNNKLMAMYKLLYEAAKYYYSNFFDVGLELLQTVVPVQVLTPEK